MTVKQRKETQDLASGAGFRRKSEDFLSPEIAMDHAGGLAGKKEEEVVEEEDSATEVESVVSEEDSRRPAGRWRRSRKDGEERVGCLHSQVLRIREEESHLGQDIGEGFNPNDNVGGFGQSLPLSRRVASAVDVVLFSSRPSVLPCSPLSGKAAAAAAVKALQ